MAKLSLDQTDIRILTAVQTHGQLSKTRLAEIVNLSPTPCHSRCFISWLIEGTV